ncbi:MAG: DUF3343 domain-containing protein [bacterium]
MFCLITFISKHDRFHAEELLHQAGISFDRIPPPVWMRTNCDYALRFEVEVKEQIEQILEQSGINVEQSVIPPNTTLTLTDILKAKKPFKGEKQ